MCGPRRRPASYVSEAAVRPPCALRAAGGARGAHLPRWPTRRRGRRRPARACRDLHWPQRPDRPWQGGTGLATPSRWPHGGLSVCRVQQAGTHVSVQVLTQGWCSDRPVAAVLVRLMGDYMHAHAWRTVCNMHTPKRTSLERRQRAAEGQATGGQVTGDRGPRRRTQASPSWSWWRWWRRSRAWGHLRG